MAKTKARRKRAPAVKAVPRRAAPKKRPGSRRKAKTAPAGIPLLDLSLQHRKLHAPLRAAFERVLASNHFILGPEVAGFERAIADYIGVEHAVGVSSGTDAILLALMALGIGPGDEVIVPSFSFFATAGCVARVGARPVFVDIDPATYNLDIARVAERIGPATKAIIPVHLYGQTCDLEALTDLAAQHGLAIVEDAAQAIGARSERFRAGAAGSFGCFSFFPSKNLGALGDAGLLTTNDAALAQRARLLRAHGAEPKYYHALIGGNFRLDALQAAFLGVKLPHLDRWAAARQRNAARYDAIFGAAAISPDLFTLPVRRYREHVYNQYVVRCPHRDALLSHLRERGIGSEVYYPLPLHLQACFAYLGEAAGSHLHAERACREVLALPVHPDLRASEIERVAAAVLDYLASVSSSSR